MWLMLSMSEAPTYLYPVLKQTNNSFPSCDFAYSRQRNNLLHGILSILSKKSLNIPKRLPEAVNRKTDKAIVQKKIDKNINNDLYNIIKKLHIEQPPPKNQRKQHRFNL